MPARPWRCAWRLLWVAVAHAQVIETDLLHSGSVVISPRAARDPTPPKALVILVGHLRSFPLVSAAMKSLLDVMMAGAPYAVYMHTWTELDHNDEVWWRKAVRGLTGAPRRRIALPQPHHAIRPAGPPRRSVPPLAAPPAGSPAQVRCAA